MKNFHFVIILVIINNSLIAQVPVFEEPRHKVVLLNKYVRLIDVHIAPHDTSLYHRHSQASVIVWLTKNKTGSQLLGGEPVSGESVTGDTMFIPFDNKPVTHRVWNEDTTIFHVMDIEIFSRKDTVGCSRLKESSIKFGWEEKNVRVYTIHMEKGETCFVNPGSCPHLLILISGTATTSQTEMTKQSPATLNPGNFIWYAPGSGFQINNSSATGTDCVLLELK